jgi:hypothetical protein
LANRTSASALLRGEQAHLAPDILPTLGQTLLCCESFERGHETPADRSLGSGFSAPPMTFEVNGRQYVGIVSEPSPGAIGLVNTPELREQRQALVLYVFGL